MSLTDSPAQPKLNCNPEGDIIHSQACTGNLEGMKPSTRLFGRGGK